MIELIVVFVLWNKVKDKLFAKGYEKTLKYQILVPIFWFGGEVAGIFWYGVILGAQGKEPTGFSLSMYLVALLGACIGVALVLIFVALQPDLTPKDETPLQRRRRRSY
jgi:hypothetical protein